MSVCQVQAGPGRADSRPGSLQSLFWFPGRNKARSNVLWRARTSTGPTGGGGGQGTVTSDDTSCLSWLVSRGREGAGLTDHNSSHWTHQGLLALEVSCHTASQARSGHCELT